MNFLLAQESVEERLASNKFPVSTETALDIIKSTSNAKKQTKERNHEA